MVTKHFDKENVYQQMIIAACASLVDEGFSAKDVMELLDEMKSQLWSALSEIERQKKGNT